MFLLFQFLQKVYREDLDELIDEADYEMYKNRKAAKETETEFKKKILTGIKPSQNVDSKKPGKVYLQFDVLEVIETTRWLLSNVLMQFLKSK